MAHKSESRPDAPGHRADDSIDRDTNRLPEDEYEPTPGAGVDQLLAARTDGPIFEGVAKPLDALEVAARHLAGVVNRVTLAVTDDGVTLRGVADSKAAMVEGHLARKDFTARYKVHQSGSVQVPADDLVDTIRFLDDDAAMLSLEADAADELATLKMFDNDRIAGLDLPTGDDRGDPARLRLPSAAFPVAATVGSGVPLGELASAHTHAVLSDYESPIRPHMDLSRAGRHRRKANNVEPSVLVTASAPTTPLRSTDTTVSGDYAKQKAVLTLESSAVDVAPVVLGAADEAVADLASFSYAEPPESDRATAAEWMPLFESDEVEAAHEGNEVLAQTGIGAPQLKNVLGKPTKRHLKASHEVAFGWGLPFKVKRSFRGGGFARMYLAPRVTLP